MNLAENNIGVIEKKDKINKEHKVITNTSNKFKDIFSRPKIVNSGKITDEDEENSEYEKMYSLSFTNWFFTFLIQDIPIIGEIALLIWAISDKYSEGKKQYAKARLIYKLIFDILAFTTLYILFVVGMNVLEGVIEYMSML